ncbi:hypothetical protein [Psychroflexus sediminis]|uniref:Uncharacterized protein n=1 Tax=Psychroflexus sediminis TaxID=470826 RepID=A0A1G7UT62_9FLAO|nr:hypothetical protein [Psychroflexus sediminis]SDG50309.1 hypothetical protein SAMN04488027_102251 [Psychroflexus sediminis]
MIEFLIEFRKYTVYLLILLFVIAIISIIFLFNKKHQLKGVIGIVCLFITAIFLLGINMIISTSLRTDIAEKAKSALANKSKVLVNGKKRNIDSEKLLTDLTEINGWYFTNKSEPETEFLISVISKNDTLELILKRDSKIDKKYWTYYPKYDYELELDLLETESLSELEHE